MAGVDARAAAESQYLTIDRVCLGRAEDLLPRIQPNSVACSIWSPPYHVGKGYEQEYTYPDWASLLETVIGHHTRVLKPGGFLAINIADILCFPDPSMPRLMAANVTRRKVSVTKEQVLAAWAQHPHYNRYQIAELLGCSEQTVDRRIKGNNIRGGKYACQTRVKLVGGMIEGMASRAHLYLYDRRIWVKDPAWENSRWHTMSYRSVDEFEYLYIFWKPGPTVIDRNRLRKQEWIEWGSRGVWHIASVRTNHDHEAKFPLELPRRLIRLLTDKGELVLDCFIGSGTTAVAAILEDRHYIGIDKEPHYVELAQKACLAAERSAQLRLIP
jgi:DNA modification methylase